MCTCGVVFSGHVAFLRCCIVALLRRCVVALCIVRRTSIPMGSRLTGYLQATAYLQRGRYSGLYRTAGAGAPGRGALQIQGRRDRAAQLRNSEVVGPFSPDCVPTECAPFSSPSSENRIVYLPIFNVGRGCCCNTQQDVPRPHALLSDHPLCRLARDQGRPRNGLFPH